MSPTTSARYVSLYLRASTWGAIASATIPVMLLWALCISDVPLVATLLLILLGYRAVRENAVIFPSLHYNVAFYEDGYLSHASTLSRIEDMDTSYCWFFLRVKTQGQWYLLWRDSCALRQYHQVIAYAKWYRALKSAA